MTDLAALITVLNRQPARTRRLNRAALVGVSKHAYTTRLPLSARSSRALQLQATELPEYARGTGPRGISTHAVH